MLAKSGSVNIARPMPALESFIKYRIFKGIRSRSCLSLDLARPVALPVPFQGYDTLPCYPLDSSLARYTAGGTIISGLSRFRRIFSGVPSGIIPVSVAPPGRMRLTVIPVP